MQSVQGDVRKQDVEMYGKSVSVDYTASLDAIVIGIIDNASERKEIVLQDCSMPYTMNSSFVLMLYLKGDSTTETSWSCYEGTGYIDYFDYLGDELVEVNFSEPILCKKIQQSGMFTTTYWISSEGVILKIQQEMDDNYTVLFELNETN